MDQSEKYSLALVATLLSRFVKRWNSPAEKTKHAETNSSYDSDAQASFPPRAGGLHGPAPPELTARARAQQRSAGPRIRTARVPENFESLLHWRQSRLVCNS